VEEEGTGVDDDDGAGSGDGEGVDEEVEVVVSSDDTDVVTGGVEVGGVAVAAIDDTEGAHVPFTGVIKHVTAVHPPRNIPNRLS
jgi:hypothetical protein